MVATESRAVHTTSVVYSLGSCTVNTRTKGEPALPTPLEASLANVIPGATPAVHVTLSMTLLLSVALALKVTSVPDGDVAVTSAATGPGLGFASDALVVLPPERTGFGDVMVRDSDGRVTSVGGQSATRTGAH